MTLLYSIALRPNHSTASIPNIPAANAATKQLGGKRVFTDKKNSTKYEKEKKFIFYKTRKNRDTE